MGTSLLLLASEAEPPGGRWEFAFGDPSILAWLCVAAYFAAAWASFLAGRAARQAEARPLRGLWLTLGVALVVLGVNKQLDLQALLIDVGRRVAVADGWYANRRIVLGMFLGVLGLIGIAIALFVRRHIRPRGPSRAALAAFTCLILILLLRAAPWQPIRALLGKQLFDENAGLLEVHLSELLELALLAGIAFAACRFRREHGNAATESVSRPAA